MRILLTLAILLITATAFAKSEKATEVFTLDHQMSEMCEKKIKENLRYEKGISKIEVSLKQNTITVTFDPKKTDTAKIIEGFKKIGFTAFPVEDIKEEPCTGPQICPHGCCGSPQ